MMISPLRVAVLLGSTRVEGPPRPTNLGRRVGSWMEAVLQSRSHVVDIVDPIVEDLPLLRRPHFTYGTAPSNLEALAVRLRDADAYVMCTPEYNHAPSPALLNTLNHFGSSVFSFKPSLIVSYSAGQWGGTRAAHALRPTLSELGCLPVSAMLHIPRAQEVFADDGSLVEEADADRWAEYASRGVSQLEWWGEAARAQRSRVDPMVGSPALRKTPAQRDSPS